MPEAERHWQVLIDRQPPRIFRRLPKPLLQRIREAISGLARSPWPPGCKKLAGYDNLFRIRVGDWRISYAVEEDRLIVLVIEVAPRGDVYRF
ncbi:MAG: type II toxin-antitoxin system RelE family toxin [Anaerolineae bacterium]|jgi:mRNA interferase RelE/StbE